MKYLFLIFAIIIFSFSCASQNENENIIPVKEKSFDFSLPVIPKNLCTVEERANYLAINYWNNCDTSFINRKSGESEQVIVNYLDLLKYVPTDKAEDAMENALCHFQENKNTLNYIFDITSHYLNEPDSPMRNEDMYIIFCRKYINLQSVDIIEKESINKRIKVLCKNRIGNIANDFYYTINSGKKYSLSSIVSPYTMIFFYDPLCSNCTKVRTYISSSKIISKLLSEKRLTILALYTDEDTNLWRNKYNLIPSKWINAYDDNMEIQKKWLYDIRALPSLYLLDSNKKVIYKDGKIEDIEKYLSAI